MIEGNVIKFGYGDVVVAHVFTSLKLTCINKTYPLGHTISGDDTSYDIITQINIDFHTFISINEFISKLKDVLLDEVRIFKYGNYIFDFTNYNETSLNACINQAEIISWWLSLPLAA